MSCTQSISLGCCDDESSIGPQSWVSIGLQANLPGAAFASIGDVQAAVAVMKRFLARYPVPNLPPGESIILDLIYSFETGIAVPGKFLDGSPGPWDAYGSFNSKSSCFAFLNDKAVGRVPAGWILGVSRKITVAPKSEPFPGLFDADWPGCLWQVGESIPVGCILGRVTGPVSSAFDFGQAGWAFRAIDLGSAILYETTGADEQNWTAVDFAGMTGVIFRETIIVQGWSFTSPVLGAARAPSCCDISPL